MYHGIIATFACRGKSHDAGQCVTIITTTGNVTAASSVPSATGIPL